ncbi:MAG TPA: hypothetical protein VE935_07835, partial [Burkholderiales bacterium]|nr:hypothetical protein [Burkholderiales bacterium]
AVATTKRRSRGTEEEPRVKSIPASEALLDAAVESTFPASDPIAVDHAFKAARERENRVAADDAAA